MKGTKIFLKKNTKSKKRAHERYQNLSKGETDNKHQYYPKHYKNLPEYKKTKYKNNKSKNIKII